MSLLSRAKLGLAAWLLFWQMGAAGQERPTAVEADTAAESGVYARERPVVGRVAEPRYLRYERPVKIGDGTGRQAQVCAVLGPEVFAHAGVSLRDLRLYTMQGRSRSSQGSNGNLQGSNVQGGRRVASEVPYAITLSETAAVEDTSAAVLNESETSGRTGDTSAGPVRAVALSFDLEMPDRSYTDVTLEIQEKNYVAKARVTGKDDLHGRGGTALGEYTLFDLSGQGGGSNSTLHLPESTFRFLHVELELRRASGGPAQGLVAGVGAEAGNGLVRGAAVPPSRQAQTIYTAVTPFVTMTDRGHESIASFTVPARVPVEQVRFRVPAGFKGNFSRAVTVTASTGEDGVETETGRVQRVRMEVGGTRVEDETLTVPAILGVNRKEAMRVEVAVEDGKDAPVPLEVGLAMRQRQICFAPGAGAPVLFYGDRSLPTPLYDYARLTAAAANPVPALLGEEELNPRFEVRVEHRPLTERHPELLWVVLLGVVAALGTVALRATKRM